MTKYLIDFDSTLSNTFEEQIDAINTTFGKNYAHEQFVTWAAEDVLTREEVEYMWSDKLFLSDEFQIGCKPVPHAIVGLSRLMRRGDEAIVVSDRPTVLMDVTKRWLSLYGFTDIPVIFTRSVHSKSDQLMTIMTKAQIAYLYKLTHVVEDSPHHSLGLAERKYIQKVYLLDRPNNRHIEHEKIQRVQDWSEID